MCWQEDLPCPDDLDELGPLFGEVTPLDCPTPSSSRLTHPPSTLLSSSFARCADLFNHASPSGTTSRATLDPPVITLDDQDDTDPPFGLTKFAAIHKQAGEQLQSLMSDYPPAPLDLPVAKYDNHTPMTMYYGGQLVHYQLRHSIPQLVVYHSFQPHTVPVDQDLVKVAKDGAELIFYINVPASDLSDLFRPFIWAGSLLRPQSRKQTDPASSLTFRQFMSHEQVRRHTSLTPASNSHKQWVESNRSNLTIIENIMSEVQKDRQYHIPIAHVDIVSSNTGVSQYLRAPLIPWNSNPRSSSDLRLLLKPSVGQSFLADEREARAAAYLYWVVLQPVLLSSELNEIMQNTVVALKREGKQTFSSLASGQQGALQLALKPLQNMFSRSLVKSFSIKHNLRLSVLGHLRPFALYDLLLSSSLLCPGLFPDSSWAEASELLKQSMDSPTLRAWDGKTPTFATPSSSRPRPFRAALPPPRTPRSPERARRSDGPSDRSFRRPNRRGDRQYRSYRGRGGHSSRGRSFHSSTSTTATRRGNPNGNANNSANSRKRSNYGNASRRSGSRGRAGSSSGHRGRQYGRSF